MHNDGGETPAREAQLGLWDAVSIILGIVIGVGIYETPPLVFQNVPGPWVGLGVWAIAGLLSFVGALCYAELATTYPRTGGDYVYLTRAYGSWVGFLYGWAQLAVILTGNIGMMAYVFADYARTVWNFGPATTVWFACCPIVVLTLLNILGIRFGKRTQNLLTSLKVLGLGGIIVAGFLGSPAEMVPNEKSASFDAIAFAMVLVFLTYGGWNDAAYVAADVRDGRRNISRTLMIGTLLITVIYLFVNTAYLWGLGFEGVRQSKAVAVDLLAAPFGTTGARVMGVLVMISALGAVNGLIFTGSRLYWALGSDHRILGWLGQVSPRFDSPVGSLITQAVISLGLVLAVGSTAGRTAINTALGPFGWTDTDWQGRGGFELLLRCTAPTFWLFFSLTALSLFVLRGRDRDIERPFRVPYYPITPLLFLATCAYMLYSGVLYAGKLGLVGGMLLLIGLPLYWLSGKRTTVR